MIWMRICLLGPCVPFVKIEDNNIYNVGKEVDIEESPLTNLHTWNFFHNTWENNQCYDFQKSSWTRFYCKVVPVVSLVDLARFSYNRPYLEQQYKQ